MLPRSRRVVVERDVRPSGPYRMPSAGRDGVMRRRGRALSRLLHHGEEAVVVHAWPVAGAVRLRSEAAGADAAEHGIERMRFALCLDHDLGPFHRAFRRDPLIGPVIRARPWLRPRRRAEPFEALAWAITEQLIDTPRAQRIQRRLVWRYGRTEPAHAPRRAGAGRPGTPLRSGPDAGSGLRDAPSADALAGRAPAELEACDLAARRALALIRAGREVASGRADLREHEPAWRRLRLIPTIGSWTVECLALHGQGRDDQLPAGDLGFVKLVGRLGGFGRRATEDEVRGFFAPYAPHQALAGLYALNEHARGTVPL